MNERNRWKVARCL